jgi:hypothetical protein
MKVALLLTGLPRKVQEGYDNYWKHIIENYDTDVYLHFWEDEEFDKVLNVYSPKKYICEKPFKFTNYKIGINSYFRDGITPDDLSRPLEQYDVAGNFRSLPMFYSWQRGYGLIEGEYDCIIRSRYDLGTENQIKLQNLDLTKINTSGMHWPGSIIFDDNLCITNQTYGYKIFSNIFDVFVEHIKSNSTIHFAERNFTEILVKKGLYNDTIKTNELPFELLREHKLWY